jgi:predicted Ser/Thr protein kinase
VDARGGQLEAGAVIGGYRIDGLISRGGMGMVYRATNLTLNRGYALKVIAPELAGDEEFRERFKREIRIAASLNHANVVGIHYAGDHEGMLFLAMDYVDGTDLRELIAGEGALAPERAVAILGQVTSALDAAHEKGLVHRDVKPANILISVRDGREHAYLTDFGLAKRFDNATAMTVKGAVVGTVDYMPPEQITGDPTDARTDVYALGCVFFQMLTGKVPYRREHSVATLFAHVYDPPPSLEGPAAAAHPTLGPVIAKAMAKASADRYVSAGDFGRDAAAALVGGRYTGPPTIVGTGAARPGRGVEEHAVDGTPDTLEAMKAALAGSTDGGESPRRSPPGGGNREPERGVRSGGEPASEPPRVQSGGSAAERAAPSAPEAEPGRPVAVAAGSGGGRGGGWSSRGRWPIFAGSGVLAAVVVGVVVVVSGGSSGASGEPFGAALNPVPTNRVAASGSATIRLSGDVATVTVTTRGLLSGAPHLMHVHAGGQGLCPPATAARAHNGHLTISTTDAARYYGAPVVSLTTVGDTSPRSIIDFTRYPTVGDIRYRRTISLPPSVVTDIRENNAVVIMHGIDYNGDGVYDDSLGISDLSNRLTAESTDPALCGSLAAVSPKVAGGGARGSGGPAVYSAALSPNDGLGGDAGMSGMAAADGMSASG